MMNKLAALGIATALVFAPLAAMAQSTTPDATPAASPDAGDAAAAKPMKHKMHKMKAHKMHKKMMKKKEPAADATPDAPK